MHMYIALHISGSVSFTADDVIWRFSICTDFHAEI